MLLVPSFAGNEVHVGTHGESCGNSDQSHLPYQQRLANRAAVYPLLEAATESHLLKDVLIVPVTEFDLSDGVFTSITFYPSVLEGRSVKLFIPKAEVLSIMILENYQDRAVLGFHPPEPRV